jgi:flagellar hook assembly protein FlgD
VTLTRPDGSVAHTEAGPREPGSYPVAFPPGVTGTESETVMEGRWQLTAQATDELGLATSMTRTFVVNATLGFVRPERRVLRLPVSGTASVRLLWRLTRQARVSVEVHDGRGTVVRAFSSRLYEPGERFVVWNGLGRTRKPVADGVYTVRVKAVNQLGVVERTTLLRVRRVPAS